MLTLLLLGFIFSQASCQSCFSDYTCPYYYGTRQCCDLEDKYCRTQYGSMCPIDYCNNCSIRCCDMTNKYYPSCVSDDVCQRKNLIAAIITGVYFGLVVLGGAIFICFVRRSRLFRIKQVKHNSKAYQQQHPN